MKQLSVVLPDKMFEQIRALRRRIIISSNNTISRAAVARLLLYLGLKAAQDMDAKELLDIAEREDLL